MITVTPRKFRNQIVGHDAYYLYTDVHYERYKAVALLDNIMLHTEIRSKLLNKLTGVSLMKNEVAWANFHIKESAEGEVFAESFNISIYNKKTRKHKELGEFSSGLSKADAKYLCGLAFEDEELLKTREETRNDYQKFLD